MNILNREKFLALPPGVLFCKYEPCVFGPLCIKDTNCDENDFFYLDIANAVDVNSTEDFLDQMTEAKDKGVSVRTNFDCVSRDGLFDNDQLFAVWESEDVLGLIKKLMASLGVNRLCLHLPM